MLRKLLSKNAIKKVSHKIFQNWEGVAQLWLILYIPLDIEWQNSSITFLIDETTMLRRPDVLPRPEFALRSYIMPNWKKVCLLRKKSL